MAYEEKTVILKWDKDPWALDSAEASFESLLDATCERLWEKRVAHSIRRINEMDETLLALEKELDEFIGLAVRKRENHDLKNHKQKSAANE